MTLNVSKVFQRTLWGLFFGISLTVFSLQLMINYAIYYIALTVLGTFVIGFYVGSRFFNGFIDFLREEKLQSILSLIVSLIILEEAYLTKGLSSAESIRNMLTGFGLSESVGTFFNFFNLGYYILAIPATWMIVGYCIKYTLDFMSGVLKGISRNEKWMYAIIALTLCVVVSIMYSVQNMWFLQYDNVYSIDSEWIFSSVYPDLSYYDIRHPLLSVVTFPIWAVLHFVLKIAAPSDMIELLTAVTIQWITVIMLVLIGIMLRKLTDNLLVFLIYICSFPTLLYTLSFEKYQLCVLFVLLYVYSKCNEKKSGANGLLILIAGLMPTNAFIAVTEFFDQCNWKEKIRNIIKIFVLGIVALICFGRSNLINLRFVYSEISGMRTSFGSGSTAIAGRIKAVFNMIESCFISIPSVAGEQYMWVPVTERLSILGVIILLVAVLGMLFGRKKRYYRICSLWVLFAFILLVVLNWAPYEAPLFSIIFSWAIISLFIKGMDVIVARIKINPVVIYGCMGIAMMTKNVVTLIDISRFFG